MAVHTVYFDGKESFRQELQAVAHRIAAIHPGFLGAEHSYEENGFAILVSYWTDRASFEDWNAKSIQHIWDEFDIPVGTSIFSHKIQRVGMVELEEHLFGEAPTINLDDDA